MFDSFQGGVRRLWPALALIAVLVGVLVLPACSAGLQTPAGGQPGSEDPDSQESIQEAVERAQRESGVRVGVLLEDRTTGQSESVDPSLRVRAGSTDKVAIAMAVFKMYAERGAAVPDEDQELIRESLKASDNVATEALFEQLGQTRDEQTAALLEVYRLTGATDVGDTDGWGETEVGAQSLMALLGALRDPPAWLGEDAAAVIRSDMSVEEDVDDSQAFGLGALAQDDRVPLDELYLKNGWLPEDTGEWSVNSMGTMRGEQCDLSAVIVTFGAADAAAGEAVTTDIARAVGQKCAQGQG